MSDKQSELDDDRAPGAGEDGTDVGAAIRSYAVGFLLAALLSVASFYAAGSGLIYGPAIPVALVALAIGQMGVHLVFFLHVTSGPDNTNNVLALAVRRADRRARVDRGRSGSWRI